jgi:hypothetical protein
MNEGLSNLLTTAIISLGTVVFGLIGIAAKNWITTTVLKWPSKTEQSKAAFKEVLEQHEQYKSSARLVARRAVDRWVAMVSDIVRALLEGSNHACGDDAIEDTSDRVDLVGESARYMQLELYMGSVDTNGWEKKDDLQWKTLCDSLFESIMTSTLEYYRFRFKSKIITWRMVSDEMERNTKDFRQEFDTCMLSLKALSKEYHATELNRK